MKRFASPQIITALILAVFALVAFAPATHVYAQQSALFPNELTDDGDVLGEDTDPTPTTTTPTTFGDESNSNDSDSGDVAGITSADEGGGSSSVMIALLILVAFIVMGLIFMAMRRRNEQQQYQV